MCKSKALGGNNNICGKCIKKFCERLPEKTPQKQFSDMLQIAGLDVDKNAAQQTENGDRFVTDIELKIIVRVLGVLHQGLLG